MAILCDICNGILMMEGGGKYALCENCGMKHSVERVREKANIKLEPASEPSISDNVNFAEPTPRTSLINSDNIIPNVAAASNNDEIYDVDFCVVEDNASYYTRNYDKEELATLEGRVGDYMSLVDSRSYEELHNDIKGFFADPLFSDYTIEENVAPQCFGAHPKGMVINFLFKKGGRPVLAVAILRSPSRKHGAVTGTIEACKNCGIKYIDFKVGMPNTKFYVLRKTLTNII